MIDISVVQILDGMKLEVGATNHSNIAYEDWVVCSEDLDAIVGRTFEAVGFTFSMSTIINQSRFVTHKLKLCSSPPTMK